jgi:HSP20 family protein
MSGTTLQRRPAAYTPFVSTLAKEIDEARDRMRRMFADPFGEAPMAQAVGLFPAAEIAETPSAFTVTAELPGLTADDVTVEFEEGLLTIRGEKEEKRDQQENQFHLMERAYGTFRRSFAFPATVNRDAITADFADGVLTVMLPKAPEVAQATKIEVRARKG